jgi:hypothetical protein
MGPTSGAMLDQCGAAFFGKTGLEAGLAALAVRDRSCPTLDCAVAEDEAAASTMSEDKTQESKCGK